MIEPRHLGNDKAIEAELLRLQRQRGMIAATIRQGFATDKQMKAERSEIDRCERQCERALARAKRPDLHRSRFN